MKGKLYMGCIMSSRFVNMVEILGVCFTVFVDYDGRA